MVELVDTLVLETSEVIHESSSLSIPTKIYSGVSLVWFKAPDQGSGDHTFESYTPNHCGLLVIMEAHQFCKLEERVRFPYGPPLLRGILIGKEISSYLM